MNFDVIFLNNGDINLQTSTNVYSYVDPAQAAHDVRLLLDGEADDTWDGSPDMRIEYDHDTERNGGYLWHTRDDVESAVRAGVTDAGWGRNVEEFYSALGIKVD